MKKLPAYKITKKGITYDLFDLPKSEDFIYHGDINLSGLGITNLKEAGIDLSNVYVCGVFDASNNALSSMEGAPYAVGVGDFRGNQLVDLSGHPEVNHLLDCRGNKNIGSEDNPLENRPQLYVCDENAHEKKAVLDAAKKYMNGDRIILSYARQKLQKS